MKKPKRVRFEVETRFGMYELQAYDLGSGVFLHRPTICAPTTLTLKGVRVGVRGWVVSAANGYQIKYLHRAHTIAEIATAAEKTLCLVDWTTTTLPVRKDKPFTMPQMFIDARLLFIKELKEWL